MTLVRENIDRFTRGGDPYRKLGVGMTAERWKLQLDKLIELIANDSAGGWNDEDVESKDTHTYFLNTSFQYQNNDIDYVVLIEEEDGFLWGIANKLAPFVGQPSWDSYLVKKDLVFSSHSLNDVLRILIDSVHPNIDQEMRRLQDIKKIYKTP